MKFVSKLALAVALAAPCVHSGLALAQDVAAPATAPNTGALTFSGGADIATAYYFRGYLQENAGVIVEPYFGVAAKIVQADDFTIGFSVSSWNSLHSEHTGADNPGPDIWYESDIYVSAPISFGIGDYGALTITPSYYVYLYPNGAFESIQEALLTVAYDDTKLWKKLGITFYDDFALKPYVTAAYELQDGNSSEDGYLEVGIAPTYVAKIGEYSLPLTFPISLGMSYDTYFTDNDGGNDFFGYILAGVQTSIPIPLDPKYGSFAVTGGAYYENLFSDSLEETNNDSPHVVWGKVGFTFSY